MEKLVVWIIIGIFYYIFKTIMSLAGTQNRPNRQAHQYTPPDLSKYRSAAPRKNVIISSESKKPATAQGLEGFSTFDESAVPEIVDDTVEEAPDQVVSDPYSVEIAEDSTARESVDEDFYAHTRISATKTNTPVTSAFSFHPTNIVTGVIWKEILARPKRRKKE